MRAVQATAPGGPEVLSVVELPEPQPGAGQVVVRLAAAGLNFIDTYRREGRYPMPFPHTVGSEGAGTVVAVGPDAGDVAVGDRVAWLDGNDGSYAELVTVRAERTVPVPDDVGLDLAAAVMLQGSTAHYLANDTAPVRPGQDVLVHAGAGGVGLLLTQLATAMGARVLTTVSTDEKAELSRDAGAAEVLRYDLLGDLATELPAWVRGHTAGAGVHTVFDGVGRATFDASLASLRTRGMLVLFGGSSGAVPPFDPMRLQHAGSVFLTRPTLGAYVRDRDELRARTDDLFAHVGAGTLDVRIGVRFPLESAADAHRALEGRMTTGKVLLVP
ncbi:quinone oxidoreductase [Actinotalea sp. M2MS4P-6]|uniref:quinone oxidoreductase family protein n=1 Tax=Actinotalea sp. M2MS4P-6 TaxID=2983762 RepID=UPI0021E4FACE|nr:quinone oxidoreductase [Actinotalea sp. M2MS4P-6]MCV2393383.1 quinone oxidoreductase [Actinotalea sp. M2MS4P-6]